MLFWQQSPIYSKDYGVLERLWGPSWTPRARGVKMQKKILQPTAQETLFFVQRNMANLWKTRYEQPVDVPRELISAISKCGCKKSSDGSFCGLGRC